METKYQKSGNSHAMTKADVASAESTGLVISRVSEHMNRIIIYAGILIFVIGLSA